MKKAELEKELEVTRTKLRHTMKALTSLQEDRIKEGNLDDQVIDIERQIEVIQTEASMDIANIIKLCEEKTGRTFQYQLDSGDMISSSDFSGLDLRSMVKAIARKAASRNYDWDESCDFRKWAEPIFQDEWDRTRKEQK